MNPTSYFSFSKARLVEIRTLVVAGALLSANLIGVRTASATSALPFYESFPTTYGDNVNLGATATVWDFGNSASGSSGRIAVLAALGYPGLTTEPIASSEGLRSNPTGSGVKNRGASLSLTSGATVYSSFLLNLQYTTNVTRPIFGFSTSGTGGTVSANGAVVYLDAQGRLLVAKNSGTPATATTYGLAMNRSYLVVLRYKYNTGSTNDDEVALWVDPTFLGNDANVPAPMISTTANNDVSSLGSVAYFQASSFPPLLYLDEIRVATNWAGVTPPTTAPGVLYGITGGGLVCSGGGANVGLAGSDSNVAYFLYTNGVSSEQVVSGTGSAISFGAQTASAIYTVLGSNTVSGNLGWMNGTATVSFVSPLTIVKQPTPVQAVSGVISAFTVQTTGEFVGFQWRRNGTNLSTGGNLSGVDTAALVINPTGAADVASALDGYDVVVTNLCGTVLTSTRVSLTIGVAANLVWSGDGVSNLWDVATSTNWNSNTAIFNYGDNVVFNDTSANPNVILDSVFLSPSKVTVDSTLNYSFGGTGSLVGPGSLVKAGTGTLTISNPNSYLGGTVLSNGVLALGSQNANSFNTDSGVGPTNSPVTFRGGTLQLFGFGASTSPSYSTFFNPLVVPSGESGTLRMFPRGPANSGANSGLKSSLTGGGTLNLVVNYIRDNLDGDWSTFTGTINVTPRPSGGGDEMRINNSFGYANAAIYLNDGVLLNYQVAANATVDIGELGGSNGSSVGTGSLSPVNTTWRVGWKNTSSTFSGTIANDASITKVGTGTLYLSGQNTYTGSTTISNGVLALTNNAISAIDGSIDGGTNIVIASSAVLDVSGRSDQSLPLSAAQTLQGSGTVLGSVNASGGGTLAPGTPLGRLTVTNTVTLGGTTLMRLDRNSNPANSRLLATNIVYGGTLVVVNVGPALHVNDTFDLFDWTASISGSFSGLVLPSNYYTWDTSQLSINGTIRVSGVLPFPKFTTLSMDLAGNLTLNGTNGAPSTGFSVTSSTNLAAPIATWTSLGSGVFQPDGSFSFNSVVDPTLPRQFFLLQAEP